MSRPEAAEPAPECPGVQSPLEDHSSSLAFGAGKRSRVPDPSRSRAGGVAAERGGCVPVPPVGLLWDVAQLPTMLPSLRAWGQGRRALTRPRSSAGTRTRALPWLWGRAAPQPGGLSPIAHPAAEAWSPPKRGRGVPAACLSERVRAPTPGANCPGPRPSRRQKQVLGSPPRSPRCCHRCRRRRLSPVLAQLLGQRQPCVPCGHLPPALPVPATEHQMRLPHTSGG